jgi:hypothetical protein
MMKTTIQLFSPHSKQREVIKAVEDKDIFTITIVAGRQGGKTMLCMNVCLYWAFNDNGCTIYWVSPTDSQVHKIYKNILNAVDISLIKSNKGKGGDTEIIFVNGSKILFRSAASEDNLRGDTVNYMILDESAYIKETTINTILLPMLTTSGKKIIVATTPKGKNWVYKWFLKGFENKNYRSFRFTSYDSPYSKEHIIEMNKETMSQKQFEQEVLAEFVDKASVFSNVSELCCLSKQKGNDKYWAGIDIGLIGDSSVLSILDSNGNLVYYYRWTKVEAPDLIEEILRINNEWNFQKIMIENNNQGLGIYQDLKRKIKNIVDINTNSKTKPQMIERMIHLFNTKAIKLIDDDLLKSELESFIFINKNGNVKYNADNGSHDDIVIATAIAIHCYETYKNTNNKLFMTLR